MKQELLSGNGPSILFLTNRTEDASLVRKTLAHVYPGVKVDVLADGNSGPFNGVSVLIIDTMQLSNAVLEHLLDQNPDTPAILLVGDFSQVRTLSHLLSSRRSIMTRADIEGMNLIQCVHHLIERQQLHEQLQKTSHYLKELSIRDNLTRFFNHKHLDDVLASEIKKANRYKRPLSLVIVALKNFTEINENFGHEKGDRILAKAADIIRGAIREVDIPARYGDNEFAVVLPESDEAAASIVAARIQEMLGKITTENEEKKFSIATSSGVAALSDDVRTKDQLLHTALGALLEAKKKTKSASCTSADGAAGRREIMENRQLILQMSERVLNLANEAEHSFFQAVLKTFNEIPEVKKIIIPHSERVAFFAQRLAEHLKYNEAAMRSIHRAGLLHDIGKIALNADILMKPGSLSSAEHEVMKKHPGLAVQMISGSSFFTTEPDAILHHHERFDGSGYPRGISGEAIPQSARILAIAEAWDTMITPQTYRPSPLELNDAILELKKGSGTQFDPELVDRFTGLITG